MIRRWLDDDSLEVEYRCPGDYDWRDISGGTPTWHPNMEYRFKPRRIRFGDMEFPEPMRVAPPVGTPYWTPGFDPRKEDPIDCLHWTWENSDLDLANLKLGICHLAYSAVEAHARAWIALTEVKS